ncbi:hypothetical protein OAN307_c12610 [Octadecabacter antarcticus 307]|uniref:D-galactarate dehydratase n=1 Tax=Octadecabacter antarcticus 307 TaxID=391626 RepID=M9RB13_9RHOB|nr:hypothetical protein [Octadecabacter antarcticus]AGI66955.1 hypothetical protein OAN307_c12610 [Octadecabacter antarcticus 307]
MKYGVKIAILIGLSACTEGSFLAGQQGVGSESTVALPSVSPDLPPPPPSNARTVEQFDTTTAQDRAVAVAPPAGGERRLGTTIASLGSPTDPGIWLKTPLVNAVTIGRVEYNGMSANLELRPSGGAIGSGSQISLAAMRLIEAPLTALPEMSVYAN